MQGGGKCRESEIDSPKYKYWRILDRLVTIPERKEVHRIGSATGLKTEEDPIRIKRCDRSRFEISKKRLKFDLKSSGKEHR